MSLAAPVVGLTGMREALLAALDDGETANVLASPESMVPPALIVLWDEPWLEGLNACQMLARPAVVAVGGRIAPETGVETLERLVAYALRRLLPRFVVGAVSGPQAMPLSGVEYLTARILLRIPIAIDAEPAPWPANT